MCLSYLSKREKFNISLDLALMTKFVVTKFNSELPKDEEQEF